MSAGLSYRRTTGVWDRSIADPAVPVATVSSWPTQLTVPGDTSVTGWAISAVTVSPTHRRRGIARTLLESELRTAQKLGAPLAMLTVSEATIYGRFGFAPAVRAATWSIDTSRARWIGPAASGGVQFISAAQLVIDGPPIFERVRLRTPGDIERWPYLWRRMVELDDPDKSKTRRVVRFDDSSGIHQGFAIYTIGENKPFQHHILTVEQLTAATDEAYAGLWRFLLEQDLVGAVHAELRPVDEPVSWQVSDQRAVRKTDERDHLWLRIIDPIAALDARRYLAPGRFVFEVSDPLGYADGRYLLEVDERGVGRASELKGAVPDDAFAVGLGVAELSALYLGGVSARELLRAGRLTESAVGAADALDSAFRSPVPPWLSIWF